MTRQTSNKTLRVCDRDVSYRDFMVAGCGRKELEVVAFVLEHNLTPGQRGVWKAAAESLGTGRAGRPLTRFCVGMRWQNALRRIAAYLANGRNNMQLTVDDKPATYDAFLLARCASGELETVKLLMKHGLNPEKVKRCWRRLAQFEFGYLPTDRVFSMVQAANWRRACKRVRARRAVEEAKAWKLFAHGYHVCSSDFERVGAPQSRLDLIKILTRFRLQPGDHHVWRIIEFLFENGRVSNGVTKAHDKKSSICLMWHKAVDILRYWPRLHDGAYLIPLDQALGGTHYAVLADFQGACCTDKELEVLEELATPELIRGKGWSKRVARRLTQKARGYYRDGQARVITAGAVSRRYRLAVSRLQRNAVWSQRPWEEREWIGGVIRVKVDTPRLFPKMRS
ncbi:MAG TPA: hypothetical protein DDW36_04345 [Candidatus Magasanikbacteria bacterium]|nr:hypothetical protein [Candidatus Magasanikbacteria bacterium]